MGEEVDLSVRVRMWLFVSSAFNLFVWAQFELQVGIMCASAPSLRVFFRRYLGGSLASRNDPMSTHRSAITVVRDTTVTFNQDTPPDLPIDSKKMHELNVHAGSVSEDGLPSPNRSQERLTRYSHEEDLYIMSDMSWKDPVGQSRVGAWATKAGHAV
jgi:hypothetical protein